MSTRDELHGSVPYDVAVTSSSPTSPPAKTAVRAAAGRGKRRIHRPARNSLYDLMYEHAGTSLFVRPICWTDMHSEVLGARFEELPACETPLPSKVAGSPPSRGHMRPSQTITTLSDALTELLLPSTMHPVLSSNSVRTVMSTLWPEPFSAPRFLPEMHLYFGGRVYIDAVRVQIMWNHPPDTPKSSYASFTSVSTRAADSFDFSATADSSGHSMANLPMMCYIGRNQLASIRKNLFRVAPGPQNTVNTPVHRLQQLRARSLIPANLDHDAHLVGIFLAMAQRHFYAQPPPANRREMAWPPKKTTMRPQFRDLKLRILTHDTETADFIVYTAEVTASFLSRFEDPFKVPCIEDEGGCPGIRIQYTRVPIWPILGLRERLGKALGQDLVGAFDPNEIETWEEDAAQAKGTKRKREALSEVLNNSFEEDPPTESVRQASLSQNKKKRCLNESAQVGVVV